MFIPFCGCVQRTVSGTSETCHNEYVPRDAVGLAVRDRLLAGGLLPVRRDVELDEQEEVAREQCTAKHRCVLRSGTRTQSRQVREVVGGVVRVR